jgi:hypothetical protein
MWAEVLEKQEGGKSRVCKRDWDIGGLRDWGKRQDAGRDIGDKVIEILSGALRFLTPAS